MLTVTLRGDLEKFGGPYVFDATYPWEAISALSNQLKGFKAHVSKGAYNLVYRNEKRSFELVENMLSMRLPPGELILTPEVSMAGGGKGKMIAGLVLIAVAVATIQPELAAAGAAAEGAAAGGAAAAAATGLATPLLGGLVTVGQVMGLGASMIFAGIYQAFLAPGPAKAAGAQDANASFIFSSPYNSSSQGGCVPLVMGEFICATKIISSDVTTERI